MNFKVSYPVAAQKTSIGLRAGQG